MKRFLLVSFLMGLFIANVFGTQRSGSWSSTIFGIYVFDSLSVTDTTMSINVQKYVGKGPALFQLWQVLPANLVTTDTVMVQGSVDNVLWFNLDSGNKTTVLTSTTPQGILANVQVNYTRLIFLGQTGGTTPKILPVYFGGTR